MHRRSVASVVAAARAMTAEATKTHARIGGVGRTGMVTIAKPMKPTTGAELLPTGPTKMVWMRPLHAASAAAARGETLTVVAVTMVVRVLRSVE